MRNSHYAKNKSNLKNKNYKIFLYLFFYDLYMKLTTNLVLFLKGKLYLKKIIYHKNEKINVPSIKHKIDPLITSQIWKSMIWSYINYQKRNFKKK